MTFIKFVLLGLFVSLFTACGSQSSDFSTGVDVRNPLPPCPDALNCVRITESYQLSKDATWEAVLSVFQEMKPYDIELSPDEYRIDTVFPVTFFRDDMTVQLQEANPDSTYIHIRSSSRVGHFDFRVNRNRVRNFLERMDNKIDTLERAQ